MGRTRRLAALLAATTLAACGAPSQSTPKIDAVRPGTVGAGEAVYVTVAGTGFDPSFSVDPVTGKPAVDDRFAVTFAGKTSPDVAWRSPTTLLAALPPGLDQGMATVTVTAPDGGHAEKAKALCVGGAATGYRIAEVVHGTLALPTSIDLEEIPIAGGVPITIAPRVGSHGLDPFAVSATGSTLVYLHTVGTGSSQVEELDATRFPGAPTVLHTEPATQGAQVMNGFAFSPDGSTVVYVIDRRKLVAQAIPKTGDPATDPVVLYDAGHAGSEVIATPEVDPTGEEVLFNKVSDPKDNDFLVGEHLAMYEVPITGGKPVALLDQRDQGVSNGPGVFLPNGKGIVFVSDRMGLVVPTTVYGKDVMAPASNLFLLDPDTGKITTLSPPTVEAFLQPPVVSPDGRWAAGTGVLLDLTHSTFDLLLTDLTTGKIYRAVADPAGQLPTVDLDPSFSPDGKTLYATAVTLLGSLPTKIQSYQVAVPDKDPDLPIGNRTLPAASVTAIPGIEVAPVEQDSYAGCGG